ncbi:MAG: 30S ribosomal protein S2 [Candidatus Omnitrophota bacterium]|nr:MAG: 30S ribosomal protein S2 [Candidatus Omnitrophota bacterium]
MTTVSMKQLLESGVHFGHQTRRWNPKMAKYIFGQRNGIYIIDLKKTVRLLKEACRFVKDLSANGGTVLFVGTKKQAQDTVKEEAKRCGMYYVNQRWLGGMLTNYPTIRQSIKKLQDFDAKLGDEEAIRHLKKKERLQMAKMRDKLQKNLSGIRDMNGIPDAVFVTDTRKEHIAVQEAKKLGIPVVAIVDTNCDPDFVDYVIPGNDDAIRAVRLLTQRIADSVLEGKMAAAEGVEELTDEQMDSEAVIDLNADESSDSPDTEIEGPRKPGEIAVAAESEETFES